MLIVWQLAISIYRMPTTAAAAVDNSILLESGDFMLLESGDYILLESA